MSLQRLFPPVSLVETRGTEGKLFSNVRRTPHLLEGFAEEAFSSYCSRRRREEVRRAARFRSTCFVVARRHDDALRRCCHSRSLSNSSSFSQNICTPYRTVESVATARPWETRVTEGNDGVRTEESVQRQRLASSVCEQSEVQKDWGLRWENDHVRSKVDDDERTAGLSSETGGEKASGVDTTNSKRRRDKEEDHATDDEGQGHQGREQDFAHVGTGRSSSRNLEKEMEAAVRAVQLACSLSQRTQRRVIQKEEKADEKKDRSLVTVAGGSVSLWSVHNRI